jgi:diketogulonate reductase-like aldo/keto reductase
MNNANDIVPKLALGTWLMGGTKDPDLNNNDARDIQVIQTAIDEGITTIDTAQNYAAGRCEEIVGEAIKKYPRESYKILTKQNRFFLSYQDVIDGCHASMKRMGIYYVDYFVCHAPNLDFDMRDFFKAASDLHNQGLIRNVAVSNFGPKLLDLAVKTSKLPILFNQVHFSIDDDDIMTTGTYDFCLKHNIKIQAYRPLVDIDTNADAAKLLIDLSKKYSISKHQLVLAYLNSYEEVVFTIRSSSKTHWDEIKQAMEIKLEDADIESIKKTHMNKEGGNRQFLLM